MSLQFASADTPPLLPSLGEQSIRTDPATVTGVGYAHGAQISLGGGQWVQIGTANGAGVAGTMCGDQYDPRWSIFTDWYVGGIYVCNTESANAYKAGDIPGFTLTYTSCGAANGWQLKMGGSIFRCVAGTSLGSASLVGIETVGTSATDRNIDARYRSLQFLAGGVWRDFGVGTGTADPSYTHAYVTDTRADTYLAPLD